MFCGNPKSCGKTFGQKKIFAIKTFGYHEAGKEEGLTHYSPVLLSYTFSGSIDKQHRAVMG